VLFC